MISGAVACVASCIVVDIHDVDKLVHGEDAVYCFGLCGELGVTSCVTLVFGSGDATFPALRFSLGKKPRADSHKRGHDLESGFIFRRRTMISLCSMKCNLERRRAFCFIETYFDVNPGISILGQGESSELLNDGDKSDYDWLLAPRDTPMFPSLDDEPSMTSFGSRGRPQSKPIAISRSSTVSLNAFILLYSCIVISL
ncbi:hypothetical protein ACSQ67_020866 [Phaseolus vulgaris]